jgi:spore coat protein U-like protein
MCTPQTSYNVGLSEGISPGATVSQRKMVSGSNALNYQLYQDSTRTKVWGTTIGTDTVAGVGTGLDQDLTVFGAVPAQQSIPAGSYADTITVRVYY